MAARNAKRGSSPSDRKIEDCEQSEEKTTFCKMFFLKNEIKRQPLNSRTQCPWFLQSIMFRLLSSFSTVFFIPNGKCACTSLQHMASSLTFVTSSLVSLFKTSFKLLVLQWFPLCSFCRWRRKTSTDAENIKRSVINQRMESRPLTGLSPSNLWGTFVVAVGFCFYLVGFNAP